MRVQLGLGILLVACHALAWPVLDERREVVGLYCYPDHEDPALWWYVEPRVRLSMDDARPVLHFERYVYAGSSVSGDRGRTWGRGVLSFDIDASVGAEARSAARRLLEQETGDQVVLRAAGIERMAWALQHVAAGNTTQISSGELGGSESSWTHRRILIGMEAHTTQLLWSAFHGDRLPLTLSYEIWGLALATRDETHLEVQQQGEGAGSDAPLEGALAPPEEPEALSASPHLFVSDSLAVRVDPDACPSCFASTDLLDLGRRGYPVLHVWCGLFDSEREVGLERLIVDVRATNVDGAEIGERLVCRRRDGGRLRTLELRQAVRLDRGYSYRVLRIQQTGERRESPWRSVASWTPLLDATIEREAPDGAAQVDEDEPEPAGEPH